MYDFHSKYFVCHLLRGIIISYQILSYHNTIYEDAGDSSIQFLDLCLLTINVDSQEMFVKICLT